MFVCNEQFSLVSLEMVEEIANLKFSIFRHVCAVNYIPNAVLSEFSTKCVRAQMLSDFRIVGSTKVSESSDSILLSDLQSNQRSVRKVLNKGQVLRQNSLINIHEFFDNRAIQVEQLHSTNLKACLENHINHSTKLSLSQNVRLDQTKGAVVENCSVLHGSSCGSHSVTEEECRLALPGSSRICTVDGVFSSVGAELSTDGVRCLGFGRSRVGGANH